MNGHTLYKNTNTGEITESRAEAMSWYKMNGDGVEIYKNGRCVFALNSLGI